MKKGFTMIELIFVIVILGILASVAIPRLAATREDAEISATVANIRTLISDASAYYAVKGDFNNVKWNEITNVPLKPKDDSKGVTATDGQLKVGDQDDCIIVVLRDRNHGATTAPAHIVIAKKTAASGSICEKVQNAAPLQTYFNSTVNGAKQPVSGGTIAIGSSISIYD